MPLCLGASHRQLFGSGTVPARAIAGVQSAMGDAGSSTE